MRRSSLEFFVSKKIFVNKKLQENKTTKKKSDEEKSEEKTNETKQTEDPEDSEVPLFINEFMGKLLKDQIFCDVEFIIGPDDKNVKFRAHKLVLAAHSPLFETMLYDSSKNIPTSCGTIFQVHIKDVTPKAFEALLKAIYTDKVDINNENLEQLTYIGKKYQIEKIQLACAAYMEKGINIKNVCQMFETAARLLDEEKFGIKFIQENTEEIFKTESFLNLSPESLQIILADDKLSTDETILLDAVIKWGKAECKRQSKPSNLVELKTMLKEILPLVRFPTMDLTDIAIIVGPTKLLPDEHLLILYEYLSMIENDQETNVSKYNDKTNSKEEMKCTKIVKQLYNIKPRVGGFAAKDSVLLDRKFKKAIYKFFNIKPGGRIVFKLLYRGSRDGFNASEFHVKCDKQPKTLTVVKSTNSKNIFGGYFGGEWALSGSYIYQFPSWIFSLVNRYNKPVKLLPSSTNSNVYLNSGYGPTWGGGHDLHINNNMKSNNNYSNPNTYKQFAPGYENLGVIYDSSLLAGTSYFTVEEIEVLQVVKITKAKPDTLR